MAYRCNECLYDVNTWCGKYEDGEYCCQGCERLSDEGRCKCLMRDINDCPDFVPKEAADEKAD